MKISNELNKIENKINHIKATVQGICDVINEYDPFNKITVSDFDIVAERIDKIIDERGTGVNYYCDTDLSENEIRMQIAVYDNDVTPTIKISQHTTTRLYFTSTDNGTEIKDNMVSGMTYTFNLKSFNSIKCLANDEGWKYINVKIKSDTDISAIKIVSSAPIISFSSHCPHLVGAYNVSSFAETRVVSLKDGVTDGSRLFNFNNSNLIRVKNANFSNATSTALCFANCNRLKTIENLDMSSVSDCTDMFMGCTSLQKITFVGTSVPNNLNFQECTSMTFDNAIDMLNTLPLNEGDLKDIYLPPKVTSTIGASQKQYYANRGYNIK